MPGWTTGDNWHNNIAYTPGTWIALHRICEKHGVGDQFRIHYDPSHAILMGQDTRSIFQYLKDEGYDFLIGGFHVKGQVDRREGRRRRGATAARRSSAATGRTASPRRTRPTRSTRGRSRSCSASTSCRARRGTIRSPTCRTARSTGSTTSSPRASCCSSTSRTRTSWSSTSTRRRASRTRSGSKPILAGLDRLHAQDRRGRGLHVRAAERGAGGPGHPGPGPRPAGVPELRSVATQCRTASVDILAVARVTRSEPAHVGTAVAGSRKRDWPGRRVESTAPGPEDGAAREARVRSPPSSPRSRPRASAATVYVGHGIDGRDLGASPRSSAEDVCLVTGGVPAKLGRRRAASAPSRGSTPIAPPTATTSRAPRPGGSRATAGAHAASVSSARRDRPPSIT